MKRSNGVVALLVAGGLAILIALVGLGGATGASQDVEATASPTPFHSGAPEPQASPAATPRLMPLPPAQDEATANTMTNAGITMVRMAQRMDEVAVILIATGDPTLVELGEHWVLDARAIRDRGLWMITSATSDSMVHDSDNVHRLNISNLRGNGVAMELEGAAMIEHGQAMIDQVQQMKSDGSLDATVADDLVARGQEMITAGETMVSDGKQMQEDADALEQSLGL